MEQAVTLVVKSPAQRHRDLFLPAKRSWSVRRLKAELGRLHPDAPPEDTQRLIYSGKLLHDHLCLEEVLSKQEAVHVLHLVCNGKNQPKAQDAGAKNADAEHQPTPVSHEFPVPPSVHAWSQNGNGSNQPDAAGDASDRSPPTPHPFQGMNPGYSSYTTYRMLQFWFHQVYARQYYMQYMAANTAPSDASSTRSAQEIPVARVAGPAPLPRPFPVENQPRNQNAPAPANPGANQNLRMNAQGGPLMEEDDEVNRDWLDWLYSATLFYVFVNIVYFYSSMSRLAMVMVGTFLMYLHRVGWFPFRRGPGQPAQNNVPLQGAVNQDQNNNLQQEENIGEQEEAPPGCSSRASLPLFSPRDLQLSQTSRLLTCKPSSDCSYPLKLDTSWNAEAPRWCWIKKPKINPTITRQNVVVQLTLYMVDAETEDLRQCAILYLMQVKLQVGKRWRSSLLLPVT